MFEILGKTNYKITIQSFFIGNGVGSSINATNSLRFNEFTEYYFDRNIKVYDNMSYPVHNIYLQFFYEKGISNNLLIKLKQNKNIKFKIKNHNPNLFGHSQMIVKSGNQYFGHHDPRSITGLTLGL